MSATLGSPRNRGVHGIGRTKVDTVKWVPRLAARDRAGACFSGNRQISQPFRRPDARPIGGHNGCQIAGLNLGSQMWGPSETGNRVTHKLEGSSFGGHGSRNDVVLALPTRVSVDRMGAKHLTIVATGVPGVEYMQRKPPCTARESSPALCHVGELFRLLQCDKALPPCAAQGSSPALSRSGELSRLVPPRRALPPVAVW